jgi:hypothetical protein
MSKSDEELRAQGGSEWTQQRESEFEPTPLRSLPPLSWFLGWLDSRQLRKEGQERYERMQKDGTWWPNRKKRKAR